MANSHPQDSRSRAPGPVLVAAPPEPRSRATAWAERGFLVIFVCFCVWIGMLLVVLPWTPAWTQNGLLIRFPGVRALLGHNFVRGLASGLGVLDIWIGVWEAVHYREHKVPSF